jgi:signal transduction histidine kinase
VDDQALLQRLHALFMQAPLAIAIQRGPEHVYELANPAYRQFLNNRELVGKRRRDVLPDEASLSGILERVYRSGEPFVGREFPFWVDHGQGFSDRAWLDFLCQPSRDESGQVDGVITFAVDVSEQVLARRRLETLAGELRQAARARDEFLSLASHELKTPLTPVMMQAQMLKRELEQAPDRPVSAPAALERLRIILKNLDRTNGVVSTLLDVARLSTEQLELEPAEIDLVALTRDVVERQRDQLASKGSSLALEVPPSLNGTWDRLRVDQVLTNLLANAIKYGLGRPITVRIERLVGVARVQVADRGIGIAEADRGRIFERFERAVPSRAYGGFGLGLWIARQLVDALGGTIAVDSQLQVGSTFTVELPLHHS